MTSGRLLCNVRDAIENSIVFELRNRIVLLDQLEINLFAIIDSYNDWGVEDETVIHIEFGPRR